MSANGYDSTDKNARSEVKGRVRRYLLALMEELDKNNEDFFSRVMDKQKETNAPCNVSDGRVA